MNDFIEIYGARENNLKNLNLKIKTESQNLFPSNNKILVWL